MPDLTKENKQNCDSCDTKYSFQNIDGPQTYCTNYTFSLYNTDAIRSRSSFMKEAQKTNLLYAPILLGSAMYNTSEKLRLDEGMRQNCLMLPPYYMRYSLLKVKEKAPYNENVNIIRYMGVCLPFFFEMNSTQSILRNKTYLDYRFRQN